MQKNEHKSGLRFYFFNICFISRLVNGYGSLFLNEVVSFDRIQRSLLNSLFLIYISVWYFRDTESKTLVDQAFREYLLQLTSSWNVDYLKKYVQYNIDTCRLDISIPSTPVILLSDMFDMSTLEFCESLFSFVEVNVSVWKEDLFFGICKNHLLRMCNGKLIYKVILDARIS